MQRKQISSRAGADAGAAGAIGGDLDPRRLLSAASAQLMSREETIMSENTPEATVQHDAPASPANMPASKPAAAAPKPAARRPAKPATARKPAAAAPKPARRPAKPATADKPAKPAKKPVATKSTARAISLTALMLAAGDVCESDASLKRYKSRLKKILPADAHAAIDALTLTDARHFIADRMIYATAALKWDKRLGDQRKLSTRKLIAA